MLRKELLHALESCVSDKGWVEGFNDFYHSDVCVENPHDSLMFLKEINKGHLWRFFLPDNSDKPILLCDNSLGGSALCLANVYSKVYIWEMTPSRRYITRCRVEDSGVSNVIILNNDELDRDQIADIRAILVVASGSNDDCFHRRINGLSRLVKNSSQDISLLCVVGKKSFLSPLFGDRIFFTIHNKYFNKFLKIWKYSSGVIFKSYHCSGTAHNLKRVSLGEKKVPISWGRSGSLIRSLARRYNISNSVKISAFYTASAGRSWLSAFVERLQLIHGLSDKAVAVDCFAGNPNIGIIKILDGDKHFIIRLPMGKISNSHRAHKNFLMLEYLVGIRFIESLVPHAIFNSELCGQKYYGETFLSGKIVTLEDSNLNLIWKQVGPLQESFALQAGELKKINQKDFNNLIGKDIGKIRARLTDPKNLSNLDTFESRIQDILIGDEVPLVLLHGDFKIENMLFDEDNKLCGIFDWDLGKKIGFPLIDIYYFFGYSFYQRTDYPNEGIINFIIECLIEGNLPDKFKEKIDNYALNIGLSRNYLKISPYLFWIHYISNISNLAFTRKDGNLLYNNFTRPLNLIMSKIT